MIRILGDRVLVALPPSDTETVTPSGIILTKDPDLRTKTRGLVMAIGEKDGTVLIDTVIDLLREWEGSRLDYLEAAVRQLKPAPFDVKVGDCVLIPASAGEEVSFEGIDYVILSEAEIIGVIEPVTQEAA